MDDGYKMTFESKKGRDGKGRNQTYEVRDTREAREYPFEKWGSRSSLFDLRDPAAPGDRIVPSVEF
jgi:hypothetical protein